MLHEPKRSDPLDERLLVSVVAPVPGDIPATVAITGTISARNDMPIGPEGEGGRVVAVRVEAGDVVRKGQLLAQLDPTVAQSQVAAATATRDELRAAAEAAEAEYRRAEKAGGAFSVEELERRRTSAVTARSRVALAAAQLAESQARLARTRIAAPSDGVVLTRNAEVGQIASPGGTVLFRLARNAEVEMRGLVAEQDMPRLRPGQTAQVYLSGVTQAFTGTVWLVGAVIDPATRQGTVRIALPSNLPDLRPGAFARAEVQVDMLRGAVVPQTAVLADGAGSYVFIVDAGDSVVRRAVTVGGAHRDGLLITAGLAAGQRIVATAGAFLREGEKVAVAGTGGGSVAPPVDRPVAARALADSR
ncbi:MAG: efflux RND transporter periplasmic adaptor subunit [Gammaproteobacteria bacterium]|nr:efflux RND transporter periplasmic adaptor subunit [Gammaproteobacteria bacterium]